MSADPFLHVPEHARERVRFKVATNAVVSGRIWGSTKTVEEIVMWQGYPNENAYWAAAMSLPMKASSFAHFLGGFHLQPPGDHDSGRRVLMYQMVMRRLSDALGTGQPWFIRDHLTDVDELGRLRVDPRAAVEWLLSLPTEKGLVPPGLRAFLHPETPLSRPALKIADENECAKKLATMMRRSPDDPRPKESVRADFPAVGRNGFDRAWTAAVKESGAEKWSRAGPRRSTIAPL